MPNKAHSRLVHRRKKIRRNRERIHKAMAAAIKKSWADWEKAQKKAP